MKSVLSLLLFVMVLALPGSSFAKSSMIRFFSLRPSERFHQTKSYESSMPIFSPEGGLRLQIDSVNCSWLFLSLIIPTKSSQSKKL